MRLLDMITVEGVDIDGHAPTEDDDGFTELHAGCPP